MTTLISAPDRRLPWHRSSPRPLSALGAMLVGVARGVPATEPMVAGVAEDGPGAADRIDIPGARGRHDPARRVARPPRAARRPRAVVEPARVQPRLRDGAARDLPAAGAGLSDRAGSRRSSPSWRQAWSGFALGLDDRVDPLVPALQQPVLLTIHVGAAAAAYAVAGVAFLAAAGRDRPAPRRRPDLRSCPRRQRSAPWAIEPSSSAFPILTIAIALGVGMGQPGVALVLEQRPQGARGGGDLARLRRVPPRRLTPRPVVSARSMAHRRSVSPASSSPTSAPGSSSSASTATAPREAPCAGRGGAEVIAVIGDEARFRADDGSMIRFFRRAGANEFPGCD